jgi:mycothiol synthase
VITSRHAASLEDLRAAEALVTRAWLDGSRFVAPTVGDLEWWYGGVYPETLADTLRLWSVDDRPAAWTWHTAGEVEWLTWSGDPATDAELDEAIVTSAIAEAGDRPVAMWSSEDDEATIARLVGHGFVETPVRLAQFRRSFDDGWAPDDVPLPAGYRIRSVTGTDELEARVEVHRAAFDPSRLTVQKYERLIGAPHYRFEDDLVVEAPDGSLAAFAMAWFDPVARVGEFEPVGTHPAHQRRGLGRALLAHGLRRFQAQGARLAQVYADAGEPGPMGLYPAVGFRPFAFHRRYEHSPARPEVASAS